MEPCAPSAVSARDIHLTGQLIFFAVISAAARYVVRPKLLDTAHMTSENVAGLGVRWLHAYTRFITSLPHARTEREVHPGYLFRESTLLFCACLSFSIWAFTVLDLILNRVGVSTVLFLLLSLTFACITTDSSQLQLRRGARRAGEKDGTSCQEGKCHGCSQTCTSGLNDMHELDSIKSKALRTAQEANRHHPRNPQHRSPACPVRRHVPLVSYGCSMSTGHLRPSKLRIRKSRPKRRRRR